MRDDNCIFCKIANGEIPSATLYEDEEFRVILDLGPASKGHALILPKNHYRNLYDIDEATASKAICLAKKMITKMTDVLGCDGYNIVQNNEEAAGQTVFHFHMHLIPRYKNDNVGLGWHMGELTEEDIDKIADAVIQYERYFVSGISTALGAPGGAAMVATIPADIIQYYGYMLRAAQKLMYLYGFPQIVSEDDETQIDSATMNLLVVAMGVMFGVAGANNAVKAMAKALGNGVEKQLMRRALTKGTIYPIVKSIAKWFGVRMTKEVFSGFFKKAIPVVGGVIGGGITYVSFKPCCERLKESLKDTKLSNANHKETKEESAIYEAIVQEIEE